MLKNVRIICIYGKLVLILYQEKEITRRTNYDIRMYL